MIYQIPKDMPQPADMPKGMICNSYGDSSDQFELNLFVFPTIREYQQDKWVKLYGRESDGLKAVHSVIKVGVEGVNQWQSVTLPRAETIELNLSESARYSFHEYRYLSYFDAEAWKAFDRVIEQTNGTIYDIPQLLDIWCRQNLGWLPLPMPRLELGNQQTICSAGCAAALMAAYESLRSRRGNQLPLAMRPVINTSEDYPYLLEDTCPADFAMMIGKYAQPWQIGVEIETI